VNEYIDSDDAKVRVPGSSLGRRVRKPSLYLLLTAIGAVVIATVCGSHTYRWRAFTVLVGVRPALSGESRLEIPPLGEVRAHTHLTPLALSVRLDSVSFDDLKRLALSATPRATLEHDVRGFAERSAMNFALRLIGWGAIGGFLAPLLLRSRRAREWLGAPITGSLWIIILLLMTRLTFHPEAFLDKPTYTGSLQQAPWAISMAQNAVSNTEALGTRLRNVSVNLQALYERIGAAAADPVGDEGTVRVLHISDLHNNPAAVSFVRDLAQKFEVSAVIDTGDLSDFGTPVEARAAQGLAGLRELGIPYVFVAGNHDSEATMRAVEANLGGIVLRAGEPPVTVAGLGIMGAPDPSALRSGEGDVNTSSEELLAAGEELLGRYQAANPRPDIVCVHNPRQAAPLRGAVALVLCGHMHRPSVEVEQGTVLCNAGTTGAAGGRYFERPEGVPFSAAILHFSAPRQSPSAAMTPARLLFIDQVSLQGSLREYSITRRGFSSLPDADVRGFGTTPAPPQSPSDNFRRPAETVAR
jgi:predicted phosphodiesterase